MNYLERDKNVLWHPFTPDPWQGPRSVMTRAEGAYVFDENGKRYFDATSSWWCNIHGHCHPRLTEALNRQAKKLDQILFAPHTHPSAVELAERLLSLLGDPFSRIFYSDDGSTAVEAALKMSLQYWQQKGNSRRRRFLALERGYHGDTLGAVAVSHVDEFHQHFREAASPLHVQRLPAPYCYRCPVGKEKSSCEVECLRSLDAILEQDGESIAALIIEPLVLGAAGMISYPKRYLEKIVERCRSHGVLVIFDEVFSGFGRTGTLFALDQIHLRPDMVCLSKGLTSGMLPLAATVVTEDLYDCFTGGPSHAFYHGHTFTANALSIAVAIESLRIFEEEKVIQKNEALISRFALEKARFESLPHVGEVRHVGMIWAVELVTDRASKQIPLPANRPGWRIADALWKAGIWMRPLHNTLYVVPPYCSTQTELQHVFSVLYSELQDEKHFETGDSEIL